MRPPGVGNATGAESRAEIVELYELAARRTNHALDELELDTPGRVPWWGDSGDVILGHVIVHLIAETARHAGHVDILRETIDPAVGLLDFQARRLAFGLGLAGAAHKNGARFVKALAGLAVGLDTDMVEINPLVVTKSGDVMALDGKMSFDGNALFRHGDVTGMRDLSEEDAAEVEASEYGLSFIKLDGSIGCLVNGAGLAMATMDTIKQVGGEPANFLDVGGGATTENVTAAFKIITRDPNVKGIFINIFGGIMKCDTIANGVVAAVQQVGLEVPLVVRLEGTNVELGRKIIDESGLNVVSATDMKDGARKIVELTGGVQ